MFNASFTNSLKDDANFNSIGRDPWFNVKVENGTARLDKGRMPVWAFASNDFKRDFQVQMNYKLDNIPANANLYTTLVSNDCEYDKASVGVSYRPADQSYKVFFRDTYLNSTLQCRSPTIVSVFTFNNYKMLPARYLCYAVACSYFVSLSVNQSTE